MSIKKPIASALNKFIEMNRQDQQEFLDRLTDYICDRRPMREMTEEAVHDSLNPHKTAITTGNDARHYLNSDSAM